MFVIILSAIIGCQSYRSAVGIICNAPTTCKPCKKTTDVYQRRDLLAQHIDGQLTNEKARELLNSMTDMSPSLRSIAVMALFMIANNSQLALTHSGVSAPRGPSNPKPFKSFNLSLSPEPI